MARDIIVWMDGSRLHAFHTMESHMNLAGTYLQFQWIIPPFSHGIFRIHIFRAIESSNPEGLMNCHPYPSLSHLLRSPLNPHESATSETPEIRPSETSSTGGMAPWGLGRARNRGYFFLKDVGFGIREIDIFQHAWTMLDIFSRKLSCWRTYFV